MISFLLDAAWRHAMVLFEYIDEIADFFVAKHYSCLVHRQWFFHEQVFCQLHFFIEIVFIHTFPEDVLEMPLERGLAQGHLLCNSIEVG